MIDDKKQLPGQEYTKEDVRRAIAEGAAELDAGNYRDGAEIFREIRDWLLDCISSEDGRDDEAA